MSKRDFWLRPTPAATSPDLPSPATMEDSERMAALKSAFADIILNTAKEAAARILVEERKADGYLRDLSAVKEDALSTLLRLKRVMDSKISEAEQLSLNQKKKIEELEAQLNEAEDIVKSLREQLEMVQSELDGIKQRRKVITKGLSKCSKCSDSRCKGLSLRVSDNNYGMYNDTHKIGSKPEFDNPDLPSIILRSKKPESFRTGCTQRIRAIEQNLLQGRTLGCCEQLYSAYPKEKNETSTKEKAVSGRTYKITFTYDMDDNNHHLSEGLHDLRKDEGGKDQGLNFFQRLSTRKRSSRSTSIKTSESKEKLPDKSIKEEHEDAQNKSFPDAFKAKEDSTNCSTIFADDKIPSNADLVKPAEACRIDIPSACLIKHENISVLEENVVASIEVNDSKGVSTKTANDGLLKYIFKRKRKREPISSHNDEIAVEMKSDSKQQVGDRPSSVPDPQNNLLVESSRDSQRLVQVARQLISLSEKQWW